MVETVGIGLALGLCMTVIIGHVTLRVCEGIERRRIVRRAALMRRVAELEAWMDRAYAEPEPPLRLATWTTGPDGRPTVTFPTDAQIADDAILTQMDRGLKASVRG